ncbi:MAG: hypothetical protein AAFW84_28675 [Cyanobacteria bacterium J06635_15]
MKTLPINASDNAIKALVIEWSEMMAAKQFDDAFALLAFHRSECDWTPQLLADTI